MASITVTDREGETKTIEAQKGMSLMEVIREAGLPIEAACGGCCSCATCHVYVDPAWIEKVGKPDDDEEMMLDEAFMVETNSRLSCQIQFTDELEGIHVTLAPEF
ncbi:MAG: 2Fe-2S iron-sulfur cluster-binding protein [Geminicoccaceae bacterium]